MLKLIMKKILGKKISFPQMQLGTGHLEFTPKETPPKKRREEDHKKRNICLMPVSIHSDELEEVPQFVDDDFVGSVRATKLVFINNTIKRCYGCGQPFQHSKMLSPRNLVFSKKTRRLCPDGKGGQIKNQIATNAFFCVRDNGLH